MPWVLTFDHRKTVTSGRDALDQPIWTPALLQLATGFGFHPEAGTPGAGNRVPAQRVMGSAESLVKWVKGNFLTGRECADDADLAQQCTDWLADATGVTGRPSQAMDIPPVVRLADAAAHGGARPATARDGDYGFRHPARVSPEARVAVLGNPCAVPHRARRRAGHRPGAPGAGGHLAGHHPAGRAAPVAGREPPGRSANCIATKHVQLGSTARFVTAQGLANQPGRALTIAGRQRLLRPLLACDVLVLDERDAGRIGGDRRHRPGVYRP